MWVIGLVVSSLAVRRSVEATSLSVPEDKNKLVSTANAILECYLPPSIWSANLCFMCHFLVPERRGNKLPAQVCTYVHASLLCVCVCVCVCV